MFEDVNEGFADGEENKFHYYYNREERLARAPQSVRDYYEGKMKPVRGIKIFIANRSNRFILFALVIFVAFAWIYTAINRTRSYASTGSISYDLQTFSFEEEVYISLKISSKKELKKPENIAGVIYLIDNDNQIAQEENINLVFEKGEDYIKTKFHDYDIIRVDINVYAEGNSRELSSYVRR